MFVVIAVVDICLYRDDYSYVYYILPVLLISLYANIRSSLTASLTAGVLTLSVLFLTSSHSGNFLFDVQCRIVAFFIILLLGLGASLVLGFIKEIIRYETLISTIFNNIPYGVFFCNRNGNVIHMNPTVTTMSGYESKDLLGKDRQFIDNKFFHPFEDAGSSARLTGKTTECKLIRKNSLELPVALSVNEISENSNSSGTIYVFRDITRERELESSREDMLSVLYHDLRTPLSVISSYAGLMKEKDFDITELPKITNSIELLSQTSIGLLENLLEDARQKSGNAKFFPAKYSLNEIVGNMIKMYFNYAADKEIEIKTDIENNIFVYGDLVKIRQIIFNLMSNSIKFVGTNGKISISARRNGDYVDISFTDNGPGIPADFMPNVFKRFTRADGRKKGSGLGLYITRKLVEMQGGTIDVKSEPGCGTTFEFRLPTA